MNARGDADEVADEAPDDDADDEEDNDDTMEAVVKLGNFVVEGLVIKTSFR